MREYFNLSLCILTVLVLFHRNVNLLQFFPLHMKQFMEKGGGREKAKEERAFASPATAAALSVSFV